MPKSDKVIARLARLELPGDAEQIVELGVPPDGLASHWGDSDFSQLAHIRRLWVSLALPDGLVNKLVQPTTEEKGDRKYWELFAKLGMFYAHYAVAAAAADPVVFFEWMASDQCLETSDPIDPSDKLPDLEGYANKTLSEKDREYLLGVRAEAIRGATFSNAAAHVNGFDRSQLALMIPHAVHGLADDPAEVARLDINLEASAFQDLQILIKQMRKDEGPLKAMTEYQLAQFLAYGEYIYVQHPQGRLSSGKGVFSDAWLTEFVGMARRDERLRKEHGQKHLANRYERHVALLFQSFGFITVPALSGEEAADLLCIGKDQSESFTFLVDAKSSKSHYTFPKADQRALADYVRQTTSSLSDLPALKCVLLIGNGPASTVKGKLDALQTTVSVPLRFIDAGDLVDLRKETPAPIRPSFFLEMLLESETVITSQNLKDLVQKQSDLDRTYSEFVRGMRAITRS